MKLIKPKISRLVVLTVIPFPAILLIAEYLDNAINNIAYTKYIISKAYFRLLILALYGRDPTGICIR